MAVFMIVGSLSRRFSDQNCPRSWKLRHRVDEKLDFRHTRAISIMALVQIDLARAGVRRTPKPLVFLRS